MFDIELVATKELKNENLKLRLDAIQSAYTQAEDYYFLVALQVKAIKDDRLWEDDFESFEQCVDKYGIGKSHAYRIIKVLEFRDRHYDLLNGFSITKLQEMERAENDAVTLVENGTITKDMSCAKIRSIINGVKALQNSEPDEEDTTGEEDETEETEETNDEKLEEKVIYGDSVPKNITIVFEDGHFLYIEDKTVMSNIMEFIRKGDK